MNPSMDRTAESLRPPHPRRPPAERSVSLVHSPRLSASPRRPQSRNAPPMSISSMKPMDHAQASDNSSKGSSDQLASDARPMLMGKDDSGESSNADKWFDKSNNNASALDGRVADNEPPFFLQQSSSEDKTPPQGQQVTAARLNAQNVSHGLADQQGEDSSDEFRGVIDDLTIQNKKLKRRLKRYEMLHDSHLNKDKLFEVRVHGLPASKKQELEEILRKFTIDIQNEDPAIPVAQSGTLGSVTTSTGGTFGLSLPSSLKAEASSKDSSFKDSGYASASGSRNALSNSTTKSAHGRIGPPFKASLQSREQNIHSYLDDIPPGLLPQVATNMSEKAKSKLVVRRLEQIFAGKGAEGGDHQQPMQQQEVSRLAAKADRNELEAFGMLFRKEGNREAHIMDHDPDERAVANDKEPDSVPSAGNPSSTLLQVNHTSENDFARKSPSGSSPEQRPTRPLDLDLQRAQFPAENIEYMRHLGFSPPDAYSSRSPLEGHGWIYLNLLMNMAQLHTINVTTDFVKKAIQCYSKRFELSSDGRKVRWRRGNGLTRTSSDIATSESSNSPFGQSPRKRAKLTHDNAPSTRELQGSTLASNQSQTNNLTYTPLFFQRNSESDVSSDEDTEDSPAGRSYGAPTSAPVGASSGVSPRKKLSKKFAKRQNGPIIFYNNARFCTDLSGDMKTESAMSRNSIKYHVSLPRPVGDSRASTISSDEEEKKGPLNDAFDLPEAMDLADNPIPAAMEINFPAPTPMTSGSERSPFVMEVSGIGGVIPADNFAINVRTVHAPTSTLPPKPVRNKTFGRYPNNLAGILMKNEASRKGRSSFLKEVVSTRQKDLPPSALPPASCYISLDDFDSEDESCMSSASLGPTSVGGAVPHVARQPIGMVSWSSASGGDSDDNDDDDEMDDASEASLDFLAAERKADPVSIRAREREYDAIMAERLAEEIPAGSSAATAGGGSGYNSPASDDSSQYSSDEDDEDDE